MGKVTKLAQGEVHTHARKAGVDLGLLAGLARNAGAPEETVALIAAGTTARYAWELGQGRDWLPAFLDDLCARAAQVAKDHITAQGGTTLVESWLFDFEAGERIGWASR
jgi:cobalt-precorrin-5B (C1)-methyltransferase